MKDVLVATYRREDNYRGHSRINHYHWTTEVRCFVCDNSAEREMGILVNGEPCPDYYDVCEYNYQGTMIARHHYTDKKKANACFVALVKNTYGLKKI